MGDIAQEAGFGWARGMVDQRRQTGIHFTEPVDDHGIAFDLQQ